MVGALSGPWTTPCGCGTWKPDAAYRCSKGTPTSVWSAAWRPGKRHALSGSEDKTVRLWDMESGRCLHVLDGHSGCCWSATAVRARRDLRGDWPTGGSRRAIPHREHGPRNGRFPASSSEQGLDREVWLWDFGGQADQRLVHQLYMDKTALILLLFDADREDVLPGLRMATSPAAQYLGRCPGTAWWPGAGRRLPRRSRTDKKFAEEKGYPYFETAPAKVGAATNCEQAVLANIPWDRVEKRTSPLIFKTIQDDILRMRDEGVVLVTFKELQAILWQRLPAETRLRRRDAGNGGRACWTDPAW